MSRLMRMCWRAWLRPIGFASLDSGEGRSRGNATATDGSPDTQDEAERLERIALYATAGYFNAGSALDMMQMPLDIPLD